jgi:hypothetical protein
MTSNAALEVKQALDLPSTGGEPRATLDGFRSLVSRRGGQHRAAGRGQQRWT